MEAAGGVSFADALLSPAEMAEADRQTIAAGTPGVVLMERAGRAVAEAAETRWRGGRIVVLAGPGNNGGDGWVAARLLRERGFPVEVAFLGNRRRLAADAAIAAGRYDGHASPAAPDRLGRAGLVIDALFGAGARLPLPREAEELIAAANASGVPIIAVDLPSGVDGGTGEAGRSAIRAELTVTFFRRKPGHVLYPGRGLCGEIVVADIGIGAETLDRIAPKAFLNRPSLWQADWPIAAPAGHKYDRGHALVLSGPAHATGAARMAARAALRIGAGLVSVASPPDAIAANAAHLTAIMLRRLDGPEGLAALLEDARFNTIILGPALGIGEDSRRLVEIGLAADRNLVVDADAISSFADDPQRLFNAIHASKAAAVLTPHDGEFARLFPDLAMGSRLERARLAADRAGAVVVQKGPDSVVAGPDGVAVIADNAPPILATAGSGDVLAGMIGGLLAQAMPALSAAAVAVWLHGEAALAVGPGLIAEDLSEALPSLMASLGQPTR